MAPLLGVSGLGVNREGERFCLDVLLHPGENVKVFIKLEGMC